VTASFCATINGMRLHPASPLKGNRQHPAIAHTSLATFAPKQTGSAVRRRHTMGKKKNDHEAGRSQPVEEKQRMRVPLLSSVMRMFYEH
jgi:polyhydroxyalkanoate synthesis regulator protein